MAQAPSSTKRPSTGLAAQLGAALRILFILTALVGAPRAFAQAERGWTSCNETSFIVEVAVGRPEGRGINVEGWTRIRPGECATVLTAPLTPGVHFYYARSSLAHRGGVKEWSGDHTLCVDVTGSFSVESPPDCAAMGLEAKDFLPVMIERRTGWATPLTETEDYDMEKARAAGIQRLLNDAGVVDSRVDGYLGRKTRAAIATFLENQNLPADTTDEDLIDLLEQVALDQGRNVGLTLCNRTTDRIWTAIARQKPDGWESRGWWLLEAGGCVRTINEELLLAPHFVYGEIERPEGVRHLLRANDSFCIGRAQFAITGRTNCEASAYHSVKFASTETPKDGKLVFEFFDRDFGPLEPKP